MVPGAEIGKRTVARVIESKTLAVKIAEAALDKKAEEVVIIDVSNKVDYTDFLVVCSGGSERQVKIIADEVEMRLKHKRIIPFGTPDEIRAEVRRLRHEMGKGGGYILAPAKALQPGTPVQNAIAVIEAITGCSLAS